MRLIFATIVAATTLTTFSTPVLADGERGRYGDDRRYDDRRGGWDNRHNDDRYDRDPDRRDWDRRDWRGNGNPHDNRGRAYWGPSGRSWSHWDNSWGDPHRFARQWGFDRYDQYRGWQRGSTWYAYPSLWSDWGGWSWSFSAGNGNYGQNNYYRQPTHCATYRTQDWVNGRRAIVTYVGCADRWGQIYEQPGTRRIESWGWR
jgi:hypothetical protein